MQKLLNLANYALRSMGRRWQKHVYLGLIYALVVGFYASVVFFTSALQTETQTLLQDLPEIWVQRLAGGRLVPLEAKTLDSLVDIRGVKQAYDRVWGYNFDEATGAVFTVWGTDTTLAGLDFLQTKQTDFLLTDSTTVCGTGVAELRGLELGDFLSLTDSDGEKRSFQIVGFFEACADLLTKFLILFNKKTAREV
ncbi:MAG: ABC transporter permease, partial [Bacteroidota bacterium]